MARWLDESGEPVTFIGGFQAPGVNYLRVLPRLTSKVARGSGQAL